MSLGVKQLWRFWRHTNCPRRVSLIPRGLPLPVRISPAPAVAYLSTSRLLLNPMTGVSADRRDNESQTPEYPPDPLESFDPSTSPPPWDFAARLARLPVRRHGTLESVVVRPFTEHPHPMEDAHSLRRYQKDVREQLRLDDRYHRLHAGKPRDWRAILRTLSNSTSIYSPVKGIVQVIIPEESIRRLRSYATDNIWDIQSRTGCVMQLHEKNPDDPEDYTYLLLSGEKSSIDRAVTSIIELTGEVTALHLTENDASMLLQEVSPILWRRQFLVPNKNTPPKSADEVEAPEQWTETSFERYLCDLTQSRQPISFLPIITPDEHYNTGIVRKIHRAFGNPSARHGLTATSFKLALRYIARFGTKYWSYAQDLYRIMLALDLQIDIEVYDIMAQVAVKTNNLGFFHSIVCKMAGRGCPPSFQTWIHFLRLIKAEEIRRYIVQEMATKGLFSHPLAMRSLANELIEHDLFRAFQLGLDLKTFIAGQNELYGPSWLHHQTANKVLGTLGKYGRFDDITEFLKIMFSSKTARPYEEIALNIVLTHCKNQRKIDAAIGYLQLFEKELGAALKTDAITYHLLCEMAWRSKKPHMISVLWRYAHLKMDVKWRMKLRGRRLETQSLFAWGSMPDAYALTSRLRIAGVLPVFKVKEHTQKERAKSNYVLRLAMQNLLFHDYKQWNGIDKDEMITEEQVRHAIEVWYVGLFKDFKPKSNLGELLEVALKEDRRIREESHAGVEVVLEPIPVKVRQRRMLRASRRMEGESLIRRIEGENPWAGEAVVAETKPLVRKVEVQEQSAGEGAGFSIRRVEVGEQTPDEEAGFLIRRVKAHALVEKKPLVKRVRVQGNFGAGGRRKREVKTRGYFGGGVQQGNKKKRLRRKTKLNPSAGKPGEVNRP